MTEENTEIRKMNLALKMNLIYLLEITGGWKQLMSTVTVDCDPTKSKKYTVDHIKLIEMASKTQQKSCSEIFLEEWGTSGKIRPTLKVLMELLYNIKLIRAADCIANILNDKLPTSKIIPEIDDSTNNCNSEHFKTTLFADKLDGSSILKNDERLDKIMLPYKSLLNATNGFSDSCLIGAGGFGKVFKGNLKNQMVAIKRMEKIVEDEDRDQYINEIKIVLKLKHDNLLSLLAISYDVQPCVIYEFMENGSLLDCIACEKRSSLLTWKLRIKLGTDVAKGLVYLHTAFEKPFIHRDIKTANILLDNQMIAKIGDFGLTRTIDHTMTTAPMGTSVYMSPEASRGDVSVKVDVFSFGVVLLELLTGLAPYDKNRDGGDLLTHIQGIECPIEVLLDIRAGEWNNNIATKLYNLAICCTAEKKTRPTMDGYDGVFETINNIHSKINE